MTEFEGILAPLGQALAKREYTVLTPVQVAVSAPELAEADALVSAQTGSGKTVAFGIAIAPSLLAQAQKFAPPSRPLGLIVAPTRELAMQVKRELEWLYEYTGATIVSCVGGMDMRGERRALGRGAHIVVGTPGRLRDHIERGSLEPGLIRAVVLDEADEMLDLGFRDDLEYILDAVPTERRTLMFSATVSRAIATLAKRYQRDAVRISTTAEREQHLDIDYQGLVVAPNDRENAIINVLRYFDAQNALVFCATRATVNHMTSRLNNRGFSVVALSGELSQNERTHALQAMRDGRARVCVATDVAARGIDLPNLDLVIHADIPRNGEALLHRSGRTGRAGRKGTSILIVPHNARRRTERLLANANVQISWGRPPSLEDITARDRQRILEDPVLSGPMAEDEQAFARELLKRHSAEQIAAAFLRLHRAGQPAPEELLDMAPEEAARPRRQDFTDGVWFSLSVGRKDQAEARWLLPMLCRAGHITKNEIGAIRIQPSETFFELTPGCVDKFLGALGPSRKVEKNIQITRLDGMPNLSPTGPKLPFRAKRAKGGADRGERKAARSSRKARAGSDSFANRAQAGVAETDLSDQQTQDRSAKAQRQKDRRADASKSRKRGVEEAAAQPHGELKGGTRDGTQPRAQSAKKRNSRTPKKPKRSRKLSSALMSDKTGASPLKRKKTKSK